MVTLLFVVESASFAPKLTSYESRGGGLICNHSLLNNSHVRLQSTEVWPVVSHTSYKMEVVTTQKPHQQLIHLQFLQSGRTATSPIFSQSTMSTNTTILITGGNRGTFSFQGR